MILRCLNFTNVERLCSHEISLNGILENRTKAIQQQSLSTRTKKKQRKKQHQQKWETKLQLSRSNNWMIIK